MSKEYLLYHHFNSISPVSRCESRYDLLLLGAGGLSDQIDLSRFFYSK